MCSVEISCENKVLVVFICECQASGMVGIGHICIGAWGKEDESGMQQP